LPDSTALTDLDQAARAYFGVLEKCCAVAAPGTQSLIQWLPRLRRPCRVAVLGPTYEEHARAWQTSGHDVFEVEAIKDVPAGTAVLVVVNPNNPDGRRLAPQTLIAIASRLASNGGWLVLDEAFVDPQPELSCARYAGIDGLIVLRSFGKFFGLAGLRLGFALTSPLLGSILNDAVGPWAVSGVAAEIATAAFRDRTWIVSTRERLRSDSTRLKRTLAGVGLEPLGGTNLFCLAGCKDSQTLFERLARAGVYVRAFPGRPGWLRFGLPGTEEDFRRLALAL
jgi:cobalamin biosynthetic protein CobC